MISDNLSARQPPASTRTAEGSYIDWHAILAGGVFALAIAALLISFGASLGLSLTSPYRGEGVSAAWLAIAAGIWFAWVMVTGFGAGGYLAGRMRRRAGDASADEVQVRDGSHGLMVWATGALVSSLLAATGAGGLLAAGGTTVATVAETAAEAASSDYFADLMLRSPTNTVDPATQSQVAIIVARSVTEGSLADRDRNYLGQVVAAQSGLDEPAALARVDEVAAELDAARATALAAVEKARVAGVIFGFIAAATLLIGAVAAYFAAIAGGHHRDDGLGFDIFSARR